MDTPKRKNNLQIIRSSRTRLRPSIFSNSQ